MTNVAVKKKLTRSEEIASDIRSLIRARNPLLWIVTREEARVELFLFQAIAVAGYKARTWDVGAGVTLELRGEAQRGPFRPRRYARCNSGSRAPERRG